MAKIASGSNLVLKRVRETKFGETPSVPAVFQQRFTSYTPTFTKNEVADPTVTGKRQAIHQRFTTAETSFTLESVLCHGDLDELIASAMWANWSDVSPEGEREITIGTPAVQSSFTIEADQTDIDTQRRWTGITANTVTFSSPLDGNTTASFSCIGAIEEKVTSKLGTATPFLGGAPYTHIDGQLDLSFLNADDCIIQSFELTVNNQATAQYCWGKRGAGSVTESEAMITGSVTLMYVSRTINDAYLDGTEGSLNVILKNEDGTEFEFELPRIALTGAENPFATGNRVVTLPFKALAAVDGSFNALTIKSRGYTTE